MRMKVQWSRIVEGYQEYFFIREGIWINVVPLAVVRERERKGFYILPACGCQLSNCLQYKFSISTRFQNLSETLVQPWLVWSIKLSSMYLRDLNQGPQPRKTPETMRVCVTSLPVRRIIICEYEDKCITGFLGRQQLLYQSRLTLKQAAAIGHKKLRLISMHCPAPLFWAGQEKGADKPGFSCHKYATPTTRARFPWHSKFWAPANWSSHVVDENAPISTHCCHMAKSDKAH